MRVAIGLITIAVLFGMALCVHTGMSYRLWETSYFGDDLDERLIGTFKTQEECDNRLRLEDEADMREAMRNGAGMSLGRTVRVCHRTMQ